MPKINFILLAALFWIFNTIPLIVIVETTGGNIPSAFHRVYMGEPLNFSCTVEAACKEIPEGDDTCIPALCIMSGRTMFLVELVRLRVNKHRNGTIATQHSPTAKKWEISVDSSWSGHKLTMTATIKNFNISKAGIYTCYDGDAATSGADHITQVEMIESTKLYKNSELIQDYPKDRGQPERTISFKPGFTAKVKCHLTGTPGLMLYRFLMKCPGEQKYSIFIGQEKWMTQEEDTKFDAKTSQQVYHHSRTLSFVMTRELINCSIKCIFVEYNLRWSPSVMKKDKHHPIYGGGDHSQYLIPQEGLSNAVTLEMNYSRVSWSRNDKMNVWQYQVATCVCMSLSVAMLVATLIIYQQKGYLIMKKRRASQAAYELGYAQSQHSGYSAEDGAGMGHSASGTSMYPQGSRGSVDSID